MIASFPESLANPGYLREVATAEQADVLHKQIKEAEPVVASYCSRWDWGIGIGNEHADWPMR